MAWWQALTLLRPGRCHVCRFPVGETVLRWDGAKEATEMTDGVRDIAKVRLHCELGCAGGSIWGLHMGAPDAFGHLLLQLDSRTFFGLAGGAVLPACVPSRHSLLTYPRRRASSWTASWTSAATPCLPAPQVGRCRHAASCQDASPGCAEVTCEGDACRWPCLLLGGVPHVTRIHLPSWPQPAVRAVPPGSATST